VYTPYIYGSGQPYIWLTGTTRIHTVKVRSFSSENCIHTAMYAVCVRSWPASGASVHHLCIIMLQLALPAAAPGDKTGPCITWNQCAGHMEPMCLSYGTNVLVLWNQCACFYGTNVLVLWNQCACLMESMCLSYGTNVLVLWNQCACLIESMCLSYGINVLVLWNQYACLMEPMCLSYGTNVLVLWNQCACLMKSMCLAYGGGQMPHPYLAGQHC